MAENSKIEWTDHTFNIVWGCQKVSPACTNCYAEAFSKRLGKDLWGADKERQVMSDDYWKQPLRWNKKAEKEGQRKRVFCSSMADVFEDHPTVNEQRLRLFKLIDQTPYLDWLLLTKRADNILSCLPEGFWEYNNVWLGVTAENQEWFDKRVNDLWRIKQKFPHVITFVSCEPLLGPIDAMWALESVELIDRPIEDGGAIYSDPIDMIICGGESGHNARPMHPEWARSLRDQCKESGTSFFFKQWGEFLPGSQANHLSNEQLTKYKGQPLDSDGVSSWQFRVGKHTAGRLLDGVEYNELPR